MTYRPLKEWTVTTQHDNGYARIVVWQPDEEAAIEAVMRYETCPRCAIVKVEAA